MNAGARASRIALRRGCVRCALDSTVAGLQPFARAGASAVGDVGGRCGDAPSVQAPNWEPCLNVERQPHRSEAHGHDTPFGTPEDPAFTLGLPGEQSAPFVFNSPHSGSVYPAAFQAASCLPLRRLRASEDVAVNALFAGVTAMGAPLLAARFPRAWLDVNREPYELDPKLLRERLPAHANTRSLRVAGGLGTVPRLVSEGSPIYREPPTLAEVQWRIENVYRPYHDRLRALVVQTAVRFGHAVLVDCHSMPSQAAAPAAKGGAKGSTRPRADIILGDRFGTSCHPGLTAVAADAFRARGYAVVRNKPYAGGFITEHYGKPAQGLHALQIEINRALYMDEATFQPHAGFTRLAADLEAVCASLFAAERGGMGGALPLAAE